MLLHMLDSFDIQPFWSIGSGVRAELPARLEGLGGTRAVLIADANTWRAAGEEAVANLKAAHIPVDEIVLPAETTHADDHTLTRLTALAQDVIDDNTVIVAVGSGTINDLSKAIAARFERPMIILGTAPSMDGFASGTSSLTIDRLKQSLVTRTPDYIILDTDILCKAPERLLWAGLGDMLAKYSSLCDWKISEIINGEKYDPDIAGLVSAATACCCEHVEKLPERDPEAVKSVAEGMILTGVAMTLAGVSRPASGVEHYLSHIWDMRGASFDIASDYHGLQCGVASIAVSPLYRDVYDILENYSLPEDYQPEFDLTVWHAELTELLGIAAEPLIALEQRDPKYHLDDMAERAKKALTHRHELQQAIAESMAGSELFIERWKRAGGPTTPEDLTIDAPRLADVFRHSGDVRNKYVLSSLLIDLGLMDKVVVRPNGLRLKCQ